MTSLALLGILIFSLVIHYRGRLLPLHPDTGNFIYKGILQAQGEKFSYTLLTRKRFIAKYLLRLGENLRSRRKRKVTPSNKWPFIQLKEAVYRLYELFYSFPFEIKDFRILFSAYQAATIIIIYLTLAILFDNKAGLIGAFLYALYSASPYTDFNQIHVEHYTVLLLTLSLLLIFLSSVYSLPLLLFIAGLLLGFIVLFFKVTYIFEALAFLLYPILSKGGVYPAFLIFLGMAGSVIFILFFYFLLGRHYNFLAWLYSFSSFLNYYRQLGFSVTRTMGESGSRDGLEVKLTHKILESSKIRYLFKKYAPFLYQISPLIFFNIILIFHLASGDSAKPHLFLFLWLIASIISIVVQGKYYLAHTVLFISVSSLIGGVVLSAIFEQLYSQPVNLFPVISILGILGLSAHQILKYAFAYSPLEYHLKFYRLLSNPNIFRFLAAEPIAEYVNKNTLGSEKILVWGYNYEIYPLARRRGALLKLEPNVGADPLINDTFFNTDWRDWLIEAVIKHKPIYIIDMSGSLNIDLFQKATGLTYQLNKLFYNMFPVYHLDKTATVLDPQSVDLTRLSEASLRKRLGDQEFPLNRFNDYIARYYIVSGKDREVNELLEGEIWNLFRDWEELNPSKRGKRCLAKLSGMLGAVEGTGQGGIAV